MTGDRPYRTGMSDEDALADLRRHAGTQFDPSVVEALIATLATPDRSDHRQPIATAQPVRDTRPISA